jgi:hypothetical protein
MPGSLIPTIVFPFFFKAAKSSRIQIEPFVCVYCYGLKVKLILELTGGSGKNVFLYERTVFEETITQENIKDGFMSEAFIEGMEGFYFNKTDSNILVPLMAMLLKTYFREILDSFEISLEDYILDVEYEKEELGFKSKAHSNVSFNKSNKPNNPEKESISLLGHRQTDKPEVKLACRQILQSIYKKGKAIQPTRTFVEINLGKYKNC